MKEIVTVFLLSCSILLGYADTGYGEDDRLVSSIVPVSNTWNVVLQPGKIVSITFKSKIDDSLQPFVIKTPSKYDPKKRWPLLVTLHGMDDGPVLAGDIDSMVQIGPNGRGSIMFTGIGMQDVFECIRLTKKLVSIDEDRVYLCGFSMGAIATFNIGLNFPDLWAAYC